MSLVNTLSFTKLRISLFYIKIKRILSLLLYFTIPTIILLYYNYHSLYISFLSPTLFLTLYLHSYSHYSLCIPSILYSLFITLYYNIKIARTKASARKNTSRKLLN
jgi:hypothetical protein